MRLNFPLICRMNAYDNGTKNANAIFFSHCKFCLFILLHTRRLLQILALSLLTKDNFKLELHIQLVFFIIYLLRTVDTFIGLVNERQN